jgi:predicted MFS family arabinose efflux permease
MNSHSDSSVTDVHSGGLILLSLFIISFAAVPLQILTGLFLVAMSGTFNTEVGFMGQINTFSFIVAFVFSLLMGVLSIRFRHKSLLVIGMLIFCISSLGCYLAPDLGTLFVSYAVSGVGIAMVSPMTIALIGEHFPLEKRATGVGIIVAAASAAYAVGAPVMAWISGYGGWRFVILAFAIPLSFVGLLLAVVGLPSKTVSTRSSNSRAYSESFKAILLNKSAFTCLVCNVLRLAQFAAIVLYATSFMLERFMVSIDFASIVIVTAALAYTFGSIICAPLVNVFGRKASTVVTTFLAAVFTISYAYESDVLVSLTLIFIASWFSGMAASAANSLTLEQTQEFRGTMMSFNSAAQNLGNGLGAAIGGWALLSFGYEVAGLTLGLMGVAAAVIFQFLTTDPTCTRK